MAVDEKLKPCPFCGGIPRANDCDIGPGYQTSSVTCKCGASVGKCDLTATAVWNTRHESAKHDSTSGGDGQPVELPPLNENAVGSLDKFMKALAIRLGKPLIRQSFPGPDAHKLTVVEYAYEIGKVEIMAALGLCEEVKSIDSHLPKVRFDAPFTEPEQQPLTATQPENAQEWQPMATAPKDGTLITIGYRYRGNAGECNDWIVVRDAYWGEHLRHGRRWTDGGYHRTYDGGGYQGDEMNDYPATHWLPQEPLPLPPADILDTLIQQDKEGA